MSNALPKVIVGLMLALMAPLVHAQDFDGTGAGGDIELPPPPPTPHGECVGNCGGASVNPAYAAAMARQRAEQQAQQRAYEDKMHRQEVAHASAIYQQANQAELNHEYALAIQLDEQELYFAEHARYTNFDLGRIRANINIDNADLASTEGNYAAALAYMNDIDDHYLDESNRRFIAYLKGVIERQRETAEARQESTAFVAQRNTDLERQAREAAAREDAMLTQRADTRLQQFAANGGKLPPEVRALSLSSAGQTDAFGIRSSVGNTGLEASGAVSVGDAGALHQAERMNGSSTEASQSASPEDAAANAGVTPESGGGTASTEGIAAPAAPGATTVLPGYVLQNKAYQAANAKLQSDQGNLDAIQHAIDEVQVRQAVAQSDADRSALQIQLYQMSGDLNQAKGQVKLDQDDVDNTVKTITEYVVDAPAKKQRQTKESGR